MSVYACVCECVCVYFYAHSKFALNNSTVKMIAPEYSPIAERLFLSRALYIGSLGKQHSREFRIELTPSQTLISPNAVHTG